MISFFIAILLSYLIGSIPTAYIVTRMKRGIDIREYGSGNVGATNTSRVLGKGMGALVLLVDMMKGAFCVTVLPQFLYHSQFNMTLPVFKTILAIFAICGHIWTIFLKFKGGKGVATACGIIIALFAPVAALSFLAWILVVVFTKYVSLGSLIMMAAVPLLMLAFKQPYPYFILGTLLFIIIAYTHRQNIKRLLAGSENKITRKIRP